MRDLANKRLRENFKQSVKYLTLVFNDFFILALIFLFGALMYWYAQTMKSMPSNLVFYRPLIAILLWLPLLIGRLVTLLQEADMQFLFTQDDNMNEYLRPMFKYSLVVPYLLEILLAGILFPFATIKDGLQVWQYGVIILAMLLVKLVQLEIEQKNLYFGPRIHHLARAFCSLVLALITCYLPIFGFILALGLSILMAPRFSKHTHLFDWRYAVANEKTRKDRVYSVFSMFTDVAEKKVTIRRRKYLDFLLPNSLQKENPNLYLYRRALLRNPEYLNLFVRMTIFAILISWLVQDPWWALGLSALVIFLTLYQLMPMATEFDSNIMYRVYPIVRDNRVRDLAKVLKSGIIIQWLLIGTAWLITLQLSTNLYIAFIALIVFTLLINYVYLPHRIKSLTTNN